jgi:hypothetical protein
MTEDNEIESSIILRYVSNISNVSIILSDSAKLLTVLTAIYNAVSESILPRNSSRMILYARRKKW